MIKVLFVCTGNICRSPTAEGVFRRMVEEAGLTGRVSTDSAGTEGFHIGESPDPRAAKTARERGYPIDDLKARQMRASDFESFDLILAMDRGHLGQLRRLCPPALAGRVRLFLDYAPWAGHSDVPDPYYGGPAGFARVLDLIETGCRGVLEALERERS